MSESVKNRVVVLADDDDDLRDCTRDLLQLEGFAVLTARDGGEALAALRSAREPAVAVLDLAMPRMDGWEVIRAMRADPELRSIPIVVLSGQVELEQEVPGVHRAFRKPVRSDLLIRCLRELSE